MIPHEKALVERLQNEPFVLFGVNTDEDPEFFRENAEQSGVTWPNVFAGGTDGKTPVRWGVSGYPTIYVVDAGGVIRYRDLRDEALEEAVMELIAEAKGEAPAEGDADHDGHGHDHEHEGDDHGRAEDSGGERDSIPAVPLRPGGVR